MLSSSFLLKIGHLHFTEQVIGRLLYPQYYPKAELSASPEAQTQTPPEEISAELKQIAEKYETLMQTQSGKAKNRPDANFPVLYLREQRGVRQ